jgi:hypothetical protein
MKTVFRPVQQGDVLPGEQKELGPVQLNKANNY